MERNRTRTSMRDAQSRVDHAVRDQDERDRGDFDQSDPTQDELDRYDHDSDGEEQTDEDDISGGFSDLFDAADDALDFATFSCPWCGEPGETLIDACELDGTESAEWIEDCAVCCSPIVLSVRRDGGRLILSADAEGR